MKTFQWKLENFPNENWVSQATEFYGIAGYRQLLVFLFLRTPSKKEDKKSEKSDKKECKDGKKPEGKDEKSDNSSSCPAQESAKTSEEKKRISMY